MPVVFTLIVSFITSLALVFYLIPVIIETAHKRGLFDLPEGRKQHTHPTPPLGGVAIFMGVVVSTLIWGQAEFLSLLRFPFLAMVSLFFIGLKDDLLEMNALKKLIFQLVLAGLISFGGLRLENLHGFLGIYALPTFFQHLLTVLFVVGLTNAYNLIDGIDGLAGGIALIVSVALGGIFFITGDVGFGLLAFTLAGALVGFLRYNFSPAKIFMGDAGSLSIGTLLTVMSLRLVQQAPLLNQLGFTADTAIMLVFALLTVPMLDIVQVMIKRIASGRSPFSADRGHVHHLLLGKGLNHRQTSLVLYTFTAVSFSIAYIAASYGWAANLIFCLILANGFWGLGWLLQEPATGKPVFSLRLHRVLLVIQNYLF